MTAIQHFEADEPTFFRTATGTRVHLRHCPHLADSDSHAASEEELAQHPVCDWSQAQLAGHGREHLTTLDDALRSLGVPVEAHDLVRQGLRFVDSDEIFLVHSHTYAALARGGRTVAGFGKTYYWVGDERVDLPGYVASSRSGRTEQGEYGETCPRHFVTMSLTGECELCL